MPLLDGKYEILSEEVLAEGVTRFEATSPAGETVHVVWYDVAASDEGAFERYRRLLKALARDGVAAVVDVVSRPGARYVAWRIPDDDLAPADDDALREAIEGAGFDPSRAVVRRVGRDARLFALPFRAADDDDDPTPRAADDGAASRRRFAPPDPRRLLWGWRRLRLSDEALGWTIAVALVALATAAFAGGFAARANDRLVYVPELEGVSVQEAAGRLAALGLRVDPVPVASEGAAGEVLALDPSPGASLRPGRTVRLTYAVAAGRLAPVTVPTLVGLPNTDAVAEALETVGLRLGRIGRVHADAEVDEVLAQSTPAGGTLGQGQSVDVLTSLGPRAPTTFLPDLVGLDLEDARYLVTVAGLTEAQLVIERVPSDRGEPGRVLSQSLAPFARVPRDEATLRLLVVDAPSAQRPPAGLPSLAGSSVARARELASGFDVRLDEIEDRNLPDGVVLQSLPIGASPADGPLVLTVNVRPVPVPRPEPRVELREPEEREVAFRWLIEPGIPEQRAEVRARTLRGDEVLVLRRQVRGGEFLSGSWTTSALGPVRFTLTLNDQPYGGELLVP